MDYASSYLKARNISDSIMEDVRSGKSPSKGLGTRSKGNYSELSKDIEDYLRNTTEDFAPLTVSSVRDLFGDVEAEIGKAKMEMYEGELGITMEDPATSRPVAKPGSPVPKDADVRELLAKTIYAEAGKEGYEGMLAVGSVMANRVNAKGFGDNFMEVILAPGQFSAWNLVTGYAKGKGGLNMETMKPSKEAYEVADAILSGDYESPVGDATHYYNPDVATPDWGKEAGGDWLTIGNHIFGYAN